MLSRTNIENDVKLFEIQKDTVYIRSNIRKIVDDDGDDMWEYEEKSIPLSTYIEQSYPDLEYDTANALVELTILIGESQRQIDSAIAELSVLVGRIINNV